MKIALVGYGRMGHEVERAALGRGHEVCRRIDPITPDADSKFLTNDDLDGAEAAIEFSLPAGALDNAKIYAERGVPAIVGTTGLGEHLDRIASFFRDQGAYLWGSNFSIGAHLFFALVEQAASQCSGLEAYDMFMYEIHHRQKQDSPSGTALSIAQRIVESGKKKRIVIDRLDRKPDPDELHVASLRGGTIPGIHTVMIDSDADTIELRHTARNRSGFALGAVMAAEWIRGKQGMFTVEDFIADLLTSGEDT